jgi:hypothetical protein
VAEKDLGDVLNGLFKVCQRIITMNREADLDKCDHTKPQPPAVQMGMVSFDEPVFFHTFLAPPAEAWTTTSPIGSHSHWKSDAKKDLAAIPASHHIPYVATATPGNHLDLMNKVRRAAVTKVPAFVHIF